MPGAPSAELQLARLLDLIHQLKPPDRQVMLLYLDGLDAWETAEITGLSPGSVATRIHRTKALLARRFNANTQS
jgi:RNA polymerase sigma-70 factor (ECF subfamily)